MKILLVRPAAVVSASEVRPGASPPLGLAYVAASLKAAGHDVTGVDTVGEALDRLAQLNPRQAQVVELHSFAGLTEEEAAELLNVSVKTVKNDWRFAKAWLKTEIGGSTG